MPRGWHQASGWWPRTIRGPTPVSVMAASSAKPSAWERAASVHEAGSRPSITRSQSSTRSYCSGRSGGSPTVGVSHRSSRRVEPARWTPHESSASWEIQIQSRTGGRQDRGVQEFHRTCQASRCSSGGDHQESSFWLTPFSLKFLLACAAEEHHVCFFRFSLLHPSSYVLSGWIQVLRGPRPSSGDDLMEGLPRCV